MQPSDRSILGDNSLRPIGWWIAGHSCATLCANGLQGCPKGIRTIRIIRTVADTKFGMGGCRG